MGISILDITGDGPPMDTSNWNIDTGFVWVVVRIEKRERPADLPEDCPDPCHKWYLQGVCFDEQIAVEMCRDETYFVGPIYVNAALPHERVEWVGSYFPLKQE